MKCRIARRAVGSKGSKRGVELREELGVGVEAWRGLSDEVLRYQEGESLGLGFEAWRFPVQAGQAHGMAQVVT
jgi:hypothetical protein